MATKKNTKIGNNEYYRIRRTIDGKQKAFYGTSKGDAERQYREYVEQLARQKHEDGVEKSNALFKERAKEYIENVLRVSNKYATATKYQYESSYRTHVKGSSLDKIVFAKTHPSDVQKFYNELDVSMQTISRINKFMTNFCKWGQRNGYCSDFMSAVEIPKKKANNRHNEIIVWEDEEVMAILQGMDSVSNTPQRHRQTFLVYVLLYTGARISEALSLVYSDFDDETLTIQRQRYMGEIKPPKYNSIRQIPLHEELKRAFAEHKAWHEREMQIKGYKTEYVFTTSTGKMYDAVDVRRALKRFYASHEIPYKHPHAYRATFCTQLCRCGVPLEVASSLMGHKSMEVTASHYALVRNETKKDAIEKLSYGLKSG